MQCIATFTQPLLDLVQRMAARPSSEEAQLVTCVKDGCRDVIRINFSPEHTYTVTQALDTLNHGTSVWESALALGLLLTRAQPKLLESLAGQSVLEVGAGLGVVALMCARAGAKIVATDLESVLPYMRATAAANGVAVRPLGASPGSPDDGRPALCIAAHAWGCDPAPLLAAAGGRFDVILGSDIVYSKSLVRPLLLSIARVCHASGACVDAGSTKRCTAYVACETRCTETAAAFVAQADEWFDVRDMPLKRLAEWIDTSQLHIYCMKLKRGWRDPGDEFLSLDTT